MLTDINGRKRRLRPGDRIFWKRQIAAVQLCDKRGQLFFTRTHDSQVITQVSSVNQFVQIASLIADLRGFVLKSFSIENDFCGFIFVRRRNDHDR